MKEWSPAWLFGGQGAGGQCDWAPDGGVSCVSDPSCSSQCPAVPTGLYPGDGPVYTKPLGRWVGQIIPLRKAGLMNYYADLLVSRRKDFAS